MNNAGPTERVEDVGLGAWITGAGAAPEARPHAGERRRTGTYSVLHEPPRHVDTSELDLRHALFLALSLGFAGLLLLAGLAPGDPWTPAEGAVVAATVATVGGYRTFDAALTTREEGVALLLVGGVPIGALLLLRGPGALPADAEFRLAAVAWVLLVVAHLAWPSLSASGE